jgi:peptidoglycan-associated lipoprotein
MVPAPTPPPLPPRTSTFTERLLQGVHDAYFDFDKSDLRPDAIVALTEDAGGLTNILEDFPSNTVVLEGHCDERGSAEYNIALGDRRATAAKEFLVQSGVDAARLITISYGKERPQCTESNEQCWQLNRRVHFVAGEDQGHKQISRLDLTPEAER